VSAPARTVHTRQVTEAQAGAQLAGAHEPAEQTPEAVRPRGRGNPGHPAVHGGGLFGLALGALGIVFGDIGTSPLYAVQTVFSIDNNAVSPTPDDVNGVVSLIFWSVTGHHGSARHGIRAVGGETFAQRDVTGHPKVLAVEGGTRRTANDCTGTIQRATDVRSHHPYRAVGGRGADGRPPKDVDVPGATVAGR
jgi:hypothetical protein